MRVVFGIGMLAMIVVPIGCVYWLYIDFETAAFTLLGVVVLCIVIIRTIAFLTRPSKFEKIQLKFLNWVVRNRYVDKIYVSPKLHKLLGISDDCKFKDLGYIFPCYIDESREDYDFGTSRIEPVITSIDDIYAL